MKVKTTHKRISSSVLISMTDVIFLLLIFLLITSNYTVQSGLPIKLPGSTSASNQNIRSINIEYQNSKTIFVNGEKVRLTDLEDHMRSLYRDDKQTVKILSDKHTEIQEVVQLMDIVRSAGYSRVFIAAEKIKSHR